MKIKITKIILICTPFLLTLGLNAQSVVWSEDFSVPEVISHQTPENTNPNGYAEEFVGKNKWRLQELSTPGANANRWYIRDKEQFAGNGNCSVSSEGEGGNSLHIGVNKNLIRSGDSSLDGAFYSNASSTETSYQMSTFINLSGRKDVKLRFDYLLGNLNSGDEFVVSYFDGTSWNDLPTLSSTNGKSCSTPRTSTWAKSPEFSLPTTINNLAEFAIGFKFTSSPSTTSRNQMVSVAIDNIEILATELPVEQGTPRSDVREMSSDNIVSVWSENFSVPETISHQSPENSNPNEYAEEFIGKNKWRVNELSTNGTNANRWYIRDKEQFSGIGNCSVTSEGEGGNSLHIGVNKNLIRSGDTSLDGAFCSNAASTETDYQMTTSINLAGRTDVTLKFDYLLGTLNPGDQFIVSYFDGTSWNDLPPLLSTIGKNCQRPRTAVWQNSPEFNLPSAVNDKSDFAIGFRFISSPGPTTSNQLVSVALDNIEVLAKESPVDQGTPRSEMKTASEEKELTIEDPKKHIQFTVYPNPNKGQFTVDFSGIENNHEVEILLCDTRTGKIVHTAKFQSSTVDHNKVDIMPATQVEPGRYICALVCEGIRLNSTVIIH